MERPSLASASPTQGPRWSRLPWKLHSGLYFAALGLGFMCLEISLIQRPLARTDR